jgi:Ca2+-binding RTX toxin-like protein
VKRRRGSRLALLGLIATGLTVPSSAAQQGPTCFGEPATIVGTSAKNRLRGTPGSDVIVGLGGRDRIAGRGGNDHICGGNGDDRLDGGRGRDRIKGSGGSDYILGALGSDLLATGKGFINRVAPGRGDDRVRGGPGIGDLVDLSTATRAVNVDLTAGTARGQGSDTLRRMEDVRGTRFDDTLRGNDGPNFLYGLRGDDELTGLQDPPGPLFVDEFFGGRGDDTMNGGNGSDVVSFSAADRAITVDLAGGTASGQGTDTFTSIENVEGSRFNDDFTGDGNDNIFLAARGDDVIDGAGGSDAVAFFFARRGVIVDLAAGTSTGVGSDTLTDIEDIWGSHHGDELRGDAGPNVIQGLGGNDVIAGRAGNDRLLGGRNPDRVRGGAGADICAGETERGCERNPGGARTA